MAPRKRARPTVCRKCKTDFGDPDKISAKRLCIDCAVVNLLDAMRQMNAGEGPVFDKYRKNLLHAISTGDTKRSRIEARRREKEEHHLTDDVSPGQD